MTIIHAEAIFSEKRRQTARERLADDWARFTHNLTHPPAWAVYGAVLGLIPWAVWWAILKLAMGG